jgi:hypothetical protein
LATDFESLGHIGGLSNGLVKHIKSLPIFPSYSLDPARVIEVFAKLIVRFTLGEGALFNKVVSSLQVVVTQEVPQHQVEQCTLADLICSHTCPVQRL